MNYPVWQLDTLGGGLLVVLIAVFHVYIAHFAVGGGLFLVLAERRAERDHNLLLRDYVRRHARFFLVLTMVAGSITGVGIWWIISLLNPAASSILIHNFVFAWASEWVFFLIEIVSLFLYAYTFGRMTPGRHQLLGWIYFGAAWMSLALINGIIGFMLTPGNWVSDRSFWSGFFNPSFWPSLLFRTFLALIIAGLFGLVTATWLKTAPERRIMVRFCSLWLIVPLFLLLASAVWYRAALPAEVKEMLFARMPAMRPVLDAFYYLTPILLICGVLLNLRLPAGVSRLLAVVLLLLGQLYIGSFEFIREGGRRPYIIRDVLYSTSVLPADTERIRQQGMLKTARWVQHREITADNRLAAGRELYNLLCASCHAIDGPMRDIRKLAAPFTPSGLEAMISGMDRFYPAMPPFTGTAEERAALAWYIAFGLNGRTDPAPLALAEKKVEIAPFDPANDRFVLLAWPDPGMHALAEVDRMFSLAPPGNGLKAQLIRRGGIPEIINVGVEMSYWVEAGMIGPDGRSGINGIMIPHNDVFVAERVGLLPATREGRFDPYPVVTIEARDERTEAVLATTKVVAPVSTELGCRTCHGGEWRLDGRAGLTAATAGQILEVHDRLSATGLRAQAESGTPVNCRACHADALHRTEGDPGRLSLSAAIHGFHVHYLRDRGADACGLCHPSAPTGATRMLRDIHAAFGLECVNCHGTLEDQALGLLKGEQQAGKKRAAVLMAGLTPKAIDSAAEIRPRLPWINQPDCLHCHTGFQPPVTDAIANTWTGDETGLYRNRTDESGRLFCAACHASPHAVHPADNPYGIQLDSLQPLQYQGNRLPLGANRNCSLCHTVPMEDEMHHPNMLRAFRNEE